MSLRLYAINCGWQTGPLGLFLGGEHGRIRVPTPCYLIDHPKGKVLFDSGLHVDLQHDPAVRRESDRCLRSGRSAGAS